MAVAFDAPSAVALQRGHALARSIGWPLRVVHVSDETDRTRVVTKLVAWASTEAGVSLAADAVIVRHGKPVGEIWRAARAIDADLLVLGGAVGESSPGWLVRFLAQHARRPVLIAATTHKSGVVAGTSLREHSMPILQYAARFARSTGAALRAVHNVAPRGPRLALVRDAVARASEAPSELVDEGASGTSPIDGVMLTTSACPSEGLLEVARSDDADVVVVGTHETSGHTLRELLIGARRSVLAVPLGSGRMRTAHGYQASS